MRKNKIDRDEGRDISEKIALGMHKGTGKLSGEVQHENEIYSYTVAISYLFQDVMP